MENELKIKENELPTISITYNFHIRSLISREEILKSANNALTDGGGKQYVDDIKKLVMDKLGMYTSSEVFADQTKKALLDVVPGEEEHVDILFSK